jgi:hypothetical protein
MSYVASRISTAASEEVHTQAMTRIARALAELH